MFLQQNVKIKILERLTHSVNGCVTFCMTVVLFAAYSIGHL